MKVPFTIYSELLPWPPSVHPSHFQNSCLCNPISQLTPLLKTLQWDFIQRKVSVLPTGLRDPSLMSDFPPRPLTWSCSPPCCAHNSHLGPVLALFPLSDVHKCPLLWPLCLKRNPVPLPIHILAFVSVMALITIKI